MCLSVSDLNLTIADLLFDGTEDDKCGFYPQPVSLQCGYVFGGCENIFFSGGLIVRNSGYGSITSTNIYNSAYPGIYVNSDVTRLSLDGVEMRGNNINYEHGVDHPLGNEVSIYCTGSSPYVEIKNPKWSMFSGDYYIYGCDVVNHYERDRHASAPRVCLF
jgi:hypothetical protein